MDVTDDPVHGQQEQAFFNGYYNHECYAPLLIFVVITTCSQTPP